METFWLLAFLTNKTHALRRSLTTIEVNQPGSTVAVQLNSSTPETYDVVSFSGFLWLLSLPPKKVTIHVTRVSK